LFGDAKGTWGRKKENSFLRFRREGGTGEDSNAEMHEKARKGRCTGGDLQRRFRSCKGRRDNVTEHKNKTTSRHLLKGKESEGNDCGSREVLKFQKKGGTRVIERITL